MKQSIFPTPLSIGYYQLPHCVFPPTSVEEDESLDLWCNPHDGESLERLYTTGKRSVWEIPTGICLDIPQNYVGLILDRASNLARSDIRVMGKISASYKGEVYILASTTFDDQPFVSGQKVAQIIFVPCLMSIHRLSTPLKGGRKRGYIN